MMNSVENRDRHRLRKRCGIYAAEKKATQLGAKVVAMCDSNGYIHDSEGIKLDIVKRY